MFIYKITNKETNKAYIGQTIRPIEERFKRHVNDAINNILDTHFARAIRKYGPENFIIEAIYVASSQEELNKKEQEYIRYFDTIKNGYNETEAISKCGGNTYKSKTPEEMKKICQKLRCGKIGSKNPNSSSVKVKNVVTNEELFFDTVEACRVYFQEKTHRFITTRITGQTKSLYKEKWNIAYKDSEYFDLSKKKERVQTPMIVTDMSSGEEFKFNSIRNMCKTLGISRNKIHGKNDKNILNYKIHFL